MLAGRTPRGAAERRRFGRLAAQIEGLLAQPRRAVDDRARRALLVEEIAGSLRLAGSPLRLDDVRSLLGTGRAVGGHLLTDYLTAQRYAAAAERVAAATRPPAAAARLNQAEVLALHDAVDGSGEPGWRRRNLDARPSGMVPLPSWLVPREMAALIESLAGEPPP
ncbi:MAG: hypothetical protein ACREM6_02905, partial [Vulcanimicrobiaceae bacterium]